MMARNKFPEETIHKILDVSYRLFSTKGYENTSIQDVVDELGLSKGAIYYHFKSKEDILERLYDRLYQGQDWYLDIKRDTTWNGLQKLEQIFRLQLQDDEKVSLDAAALSYTCDARMIMETIRTSVDDTAPLLAALIEEGNQDGSLCVEYPREAAEVMILLINVWINPGLFPVEKDRFMNKILCYRQCLDGLGLPVITEELLETASRYYDTVMASRSADTSPQP